MLKSLLQFVTSPIFIAGASGISTYYYFDKKKRVWVAGGAALAGYVVGKQLQGYLNPAAAQPKLNAAQQQQLDQQQQQQAAEQQVAGGAGSIGGEYVEFEDELDSAFQPQSHFHPQPHPTVQPRQSGTVNAQQQNPEIYQPDEDLDSAGSFESSLSGGMGSFDRSDGFDADSVDAEQVFQDAGWKPANGASNRAKN